MGRYTNWKSPENEDRLRQAVQNNTSISGVCRELGLVPRGSNFSTVRHNITRLNLSTEHHTGQAWNRGNYKTPVSRKAVQAIKLHLVRENGHYCWCCELDTWMGQPIPLELDHIDGNNTNNELSNLRILCSNCHAQTPTFKNKKRAGVAQLADAEDSKSSSKDNNLDAGSNPVART